MNKRGKQILTTVIIIFIIIVVVKLLYNWLKVAMEDKPNGPYHSTISIEEAKKEKVWIGTYVPGFKKHFSSDKTDSFELAEIWIEKNKNDKEIYWSQAGHEHILSIYFKRITENDLHRFRLIPLTKLKLEEFEKIEWPDDYPRVRFLINEIKDTIRIEVLERNPNDSLAWETEKSIDTITLIKRK